MRLSLTVNGHRHGVDAEDRDTLAEILRDRLGLTGTKLGCEHGVCGSCTVLVDGQPVRSCLMLGAQAEGCAVRTVEDLAADAPLPAALGEEGMRATGAEASLEGLDDLQRAFSQEHGLQCGYCTPGFLMLLTAALAEDPDLDRHPDRLDEWLSSNLCRCTGYVGIRRAVARVCAGNAARHRLRAKSLFRAAVPVASDADPSGASHRRPEYPAQSLLVYSASVTCSPQVGGPWVIVRWVMK